jgi:hypothetical protein
MRAALITLAAALALLVSAAAASGGTATVARAPILGVVPHAGGVAGPLSSDALGALGLAGPNDVSLQESPCALSSIPFPCWTMRTNATYAIYWIPSGFSVDASYEGLVNRYLGDVAAASGSLSNVYSVATQYYDDAASIHYQSSFAGSYVDPDPFPASGCSAAAVCLTDDQLQAEIQTVLTREGWHGSTTNMFFLLTPSGVASCTDASGSVCSTNVFCAYHSGFTDSSDEPVLYANEPYDGSIADCHAQPGQGSPNNVAADATINTISHEHNETITDPWGDAWLDSHGDEIADICAWDFGGQLGTASNGQPYNQLINGHQYSLQQEYSNDGSTCLQHYTPSTAPVDHTAPVLTGTAAVGQHLSTTEGAWLHAPSGYAYQWQRCTAAGSGCAAISGAAGTSYAVTAADVGHVIRSSVSAHNGAGTAAAVASSPSALVVTIPAVTTPPVVSGVAAVGKTLSTTSGSWNTAASFAYQWLRCAADGGCSTISGATSATYVATRGDAGHTLEAHVSATNNAGTTAALSNHSGVVIAVPAATKAPHVSGRARVGRRLKTTRGSWSGPPKSYRYQWLRCNGHGRSCRRIAHATRSMYRLTKSDAGHRLRVRVSAVDAAGAGTASSKATARVPAARKHS